MATQTRWETQLVTEPAVVMRVATAPVAPQCGDCLFHIPHASRPDGWCACRDAKLRWQSVESGRKACEGFAM